MWPFDDYKAESSTKPLDAKFWATQYEWARKMNAEAREELAALKTKKSECKCGKSDEVLAELIKLFATFIREVRIMSDASVALKGDIAALAGKVDALIARPPTEVIVPDPATEADVADASAAVKAIADKVDAVLAPAA